MNFGKVKSCTNIQVFFESFFHLTKLLKIAMLRNFEFVLGQTLNNCV
jgi:hypothetical protein